MALIADHSFQHHQQMPCRLSTTGRWDPGTGATDAVTSAPRVGGTPVPEQQIPCRLSTTGRWDPVPEPQMPCRLSATGRWDPGTGATDAMSPQHHG